MRHYMYWTQEGNLILSITSPNQVEQAAKTLNKLACNLETDMIEFRVFEAVITARRELAKIYIKDDDVFSNHFLLTDGNSFCIVRHDGNILRAVTEWAGATDTLNKLQALGICKYFAF